MNYTDATAILSDPLNYTTNKQRKMLWRSREANPPFGGTALRVAPLPKTTPEAKLARKLSRATAAQVIKWTRRVTRRVEIVSRLCEKAGVPPKVRAMLYGKKQQLVGLLLGLRMECVNRWPQSA